MSRQPQDREEDSVEFQYWERSPQKDLLDYRHMDLEMSRWANTGTGWMSVGALLVLALACFALAAIVGLIGMI